MVFKRITILFMSFLYLLTPSLHQVTNLSLNLFPKMLVREAMSSPVVSVEEEDTIEEIAKRMLEQRVGAVIVLNRNGNPVGIVTERDLVTRVVALGLDPSKLVASKVMSSPLKMVEPDLELMDALKMMDKENIRRLGVIYKGELVGIITDRSIIRLIPTLLDIIKEQKEIVGDIPVKGTSIVGYCDRCETYSNNLREVNGEFLCEECRLDL